MSDQYEKLAQQCEAAGHDERRSLYLECARILRALAEAEKGVELLHQDLYVFAILAARAERDRLRAEIADLEKTDSEIVMQQRADLVKARAEIAELRKDARRYQWLRNEDNAVERVNIPWLTAPFGERLDAAIDRAQREGK